MIYSNSINSFNNRLDNFDRALIWKSLQADYGFLKVKKGMGVYGGGRGKGGTLIPPGFVNS